VTPDGFVRHTPIGRGAIIRTRAALIERHLPMQTRAKPTWRYVREKLAEAARSGNTTDVVAALQIALHLEGVECHLG
jgi:hypothetical protein